MSYWFKTIYFPPERTRQGTSTRVTISVPSESSEDGDDTHTRGFSPFVRGMSSRDVRLALGDRFIEDLELQADEEGRSFSNLCIRLLQRYFQQQVGDVPTGGRHDLRQLLLPLDSVSGWSLTSAPNGITFRESRHQRGHGWYPYVEGFSATYARDVLLRWGLPRIVYDPFGGVGTTQLAASCLGTRSYYAEVNPFMAFVAEAKVESARWARRNLGRLNRAVARFRASLTADELRSRGQSIDLTDYYEAFPGRDYFVEGDLRQLLAARDLAVDIAGDQDHVRALLLLACAGNAVHVSNMTRRADLRRRRPDEYRTRVVNVALSVGQMIDRILDDVRALPANMAETRMVSDDCRELPAQFMNSVDLVLTSPPYLNGTNYFRNTKIELWLLGFIQGEQDLQALRGRAVAAGINNVCRGREPRHEFASVERIAARLDDVAPDKRIPRLVRLYFSDMADVLDAAWRMLVPGGRFVMDMGDSRFYGVHVPTDQLLAEIAEHAGFRTDHRVLAARKSKDKSALLQAELVLTKSPRTEPRSPTVIDKTPNLEDRIVAFGRLMPYKSAPYRSRSWGHPLHSLCSFQGKLKPSIAHWLIESFVPEGGAVLDPLGGVGTVALEAALSGRVGMSNDKSPFPAIVAEAKLNPPSLEEADEAIAEIESEMRRVHLGRSDIAASHFGLNAAVAEYYHEDTLREVLKARRVFQEDNGESRGRNFVWASLLHILHGNRPYALSRRSHPITPFHPSGEFVYKSLVDGVRRRVTRLLKAPLPDRFLPGAGILGDFRDLPGVVAGKFDAIITSPPFLGMRFDRPNWLRLWFCGWRDEDFHQTSLSFLERQQTRSRSCYSEFFDVCRKMLTQDGLVVIHVGSDRGGELARDLIELGSQSFALVGETKEDVQSLELHGLSDKGRTATHHLLFFEQRNR